MGYYSSAYAHLEGEIERVRRMLQLRIAVDQGRGRLGEPLDVLNRGFISATSVALDLTAERATDLDVTAQQDALAAQVTDIEGQLAGAATVGVALPLPALVADFGLNAFERDTLILAVAGELDGGVRRAFGFIQDDITRQFLDFELAASLLLPTAEERAHARASLDPTRPLMRLGLVALPDGYLRDGFSVLRMPLVPSRRVVAHLLGRADVDPALQVGVTAIPVPAEEASIDALTFSAAQRAAIGDRHRRFLEELAAGGDARAPALVMTGPEGVGKTVTARSLAARCGRALLEVRADSLPTDPVTYGRIAREARLQHALILVSGLERLDEAGVRAVYARLDEEHGAVIVESRRPLPVSLSRPVIPLAIAALESTQRVTVWRTHLAEAGLPTEEAPHLGVKYRVSAGGIRGAITHVAQHAAEAAQNRGRLLEAVEDALADRRDHALGDLARRVVAGGTWDQLVVPDETRSELEDLVESFRHRSRIMLDWGFEKMLSTGRGISALFVGPPGTGKTMAASVIASQFDMELFQVDVSRIISKWMGETEKNLDKIFDEAERAHAILLFDEADSLFSKRTEVKSSHDRQGNLQLNFLLQKMDSYRGITILTSNMSGSMDGAFARRISFRVSFPEPSLAERERLWQTLPPKELPFDEPLEADYLAETLELSGGHIRSVLLRAAVLAARAGTGVTMDHILEAGRAEYRALGRLARF